VIAHVQYERGHDLSIRPDPQAALLDRLKATIDPAEIGQLSEQIERIVFHKQFTNA
jgi:hypothetical protein